MRVRICTSHDRYSTYFLLLGVILPSAYKAAVTPVLRLSVYYCRLGDLLNRTPPGGLSRNDLVIPIIWSQFLLRKLYHNCAVSIPPPHTLSSIPFKLNMMSIISAHNEAPNPLVSRNYKAILFSIIRHLPEGTLG